MALSPALLKRLSRFAVVGGLGFVVDAGLTVTLIQAGMDPFSARLIAIALAMLVTWRLNRALTFGASATSQKTEGLRYSAVAVTAATINYASYVALILIIPAIMPVLAIALATGLSMSVSYLGYAHFAFRGQNSAG